jgi:hypothetical protein
MSIQSFYTQVQSKDFARQFQFKLVEFANTNFADGDEANGWPMVYVESLTLPGRAINNVQVPYMGLNFNVPGTASYPGSDAYEVVFRCDQNYDIRATLENATFNTFDDQSSTGDYNIARNGTDIILDLLDKDLNTVRQYTLHGAYVVAVGASQYSIGDNGQIVTIPATLAYQYWSVSTDSSYTVPSQPTAAATTRTTAAAQAPATA